MRPNIVVHEPFFLEISARLIGLVHFGSRIRDGESLRTRKCISLSTRNCTNCLITVYKEFNSLTSETLPPISCPQRLRAILRDLGVSQSEPTRVYEDNLVCIAGVF